MPSGSNQPLRRPNPCRRHPLAAGLGHRGYRPGALADDHRRQDRWRGRSGGGAAGRRTVSRRPSNGWPIRHGVALSLVEGSPILAIPPTGMHGPPSRTGGRTARIPARGGGGGGHRHRHLGPGAHPLRGRGRPHPRRRLRSAPTGRPRSLAARRWSSPATANGGNPERLKAAHAGDRRRRSISAMPATAATRWRGARRWARRAATLGSFQGHGSVARAARHP